MIRAAVVTVGVLAAVIFDSAPVQSHHSNVAYEVTKVITITGVVKDFQWVNPHTWLHIVVDDPKDGKVEWAAEGRAIANLDHRARDQGGRDHSVESASLR